jgi:hypothetical protein
MALEKEAQTWTGLNWLTTCSSGGLLWVHFGFGFQTEYLLISWATVSFTGRPLFRKVQLIAYWLCTAFEYHRITISHSWLHITFSHFINFYTEINDTLSPSIWFNLEGSLNVENMLIFNSVYILIWWRHGRALKHARSKGCYKVWLWSCILMPLLWACMFWLGLC